MTTDTASSRRSRTSCLRSMEHRSAETEKRLGSFRLEGMPDAHRFEFSVELLVGLDRDRIPNLEFEIPDRFTSRIQELGMPGAEKPDVVPLLRFDDDFLRIDR